MLFIIKNWYNGRKSLATSGSSNEQVRNTREEYPPTTDEEHQWNNDRTPLMILVLRGIVVDVEEDRQPYCQHGVHNPEIIRFGFANAETKQITLEPSSTTAYIMSTSLTSDPKYTDMAGRNIVDFQLMIVLMQFLH